MRALGVTLGGVYIIKAQHSFLREHKNNNSCVQAAAGKAEMRFQGIPTRLNKKHLTVHSIASEVIYHPWRFTHRLAHQPCIEHLLALKPHRLLSNPIRRSKTYRLVSLNNGHHQLLFLYSHINQCLIRSTAVSYGNGKRHPFCPVGQLKQQQRTDGASHQPHNTKSLR